MAQSNNIQNPGASKPTVGNSPSVSTERKTGEPQSLGAAIAKGLGIEDQQVVDRGLELAKKYFDSTKKYLSENPGEAVAVVAVTGVAAWVAFYTTPGKKAYHSAKTMVFPQIAKWIEDNLFSKTIH